MEMFYLGITKKFTATLGGLPVGSFKELTDIQDSERVGEPQGPVGYSSINRAPDTDYGFSQAR